MCRLLRRQTPQETIDAQTEDVQAVEILHETSIEIIR